MLFVGSIFNRRHVPDLIRAFAPSARACRQLVARPRRRQPQLSAEDLRRTIDAERLDGRVRWHQYVSDDRAARAVRARAGVSRSCRSTKGWADAARGAGRRRAAVLSTRRSRGRAAATRRSTCHVDDLGATRARSSSCCSTSRRGRVLAAAPRRWRGTTGRAPRRRRWTSRGGAPGAEGSRLERRARRARRRYRLKMLFVLASTFTASSA